jgi:hypothetical protein
LKIFSSASTRRDSMLKIFSSASARIVCSMAARSRELT